MNFFDFLKRKKQTVQKNPVISMSGSGQGTIINNGILGVPLSGYGGGGLNIGASGGSGSMMGSGGGGYYSYSTTTSTIPSYVKQIEELNEQVEILKRLLLIKNLCTEEEINDIINSYKVEKKLTKEE